MPPNVPKHAGKNEALPRFQFQLLPGQWAFDVAEQDSKAADLFACNSIKTVGATFLLGPFVVV